MKKLIFWMFLGLTVVLASCSSTKVVSDQQANVNFEPGTTYALMAVKSPINDAYLNDINRGRIERSIMKQLDQQGLIQVEEGEKSDVMVFYELGLDENTNYNTTTNDMGGYYYGRRRGYGYGTGGSSYSTTTEYTTYTGSLTISIVDTEEETLLWYASGSKSIKTTTNSEEDVDKSVEKILESLPLAD